MDNALVVLAIAVVFVLIFVFTGKTKKEILEQNQIRFNSKTDRELMEILLNSNLLKEKYLNRIYIILLVFAFVSLLMAAIYILNEI